MWAFVNKEIKAQGFGGIIKSLAGSSLDKI